MERPNFTVNSTFFVTYNSVDLNFERPRGFDSVEAFGDYFLSFGDDYYQIKSVQVNDPENKNRDYIKVNPNALMLLYLQRSIYAHFYRHIIYYGIPRWSYFIEEQCFSLLFSAYFERSPECSMGSFDKIMTFIDNWSLRFDDEELYWYERLKKLIKFLKKILSDEKFF